MWTGLTAGLLSLFPGLLAWWWGRTLARLVDDAALPERLAAYRTRMAFLTAASALFLVAVTGEHAWWGVPVMLAAVLAGSHPARRALFAEGGSALAQLVFSLRLTLGIGGFWLLLFAAPALVPADGWARWAVAAGLLGLLLAWEAWYGELLLWLLRAAPLDRPDLAPRFAAVLARARVALPRLYRAAAGGRWANALALPSVHGAAGVLFSDTLLALFPPDELAAVFAHEAAHLEHYDRARLRRIRLLTWLAIVAGVGGVPVLGDRSPGLATIVSLGWVVLLVSALGVRVAFHRAHEAASDRRAVELCGDAEALGRALVKLHALARLPRRWALDVERRASHPSLAHRLQALHAAGGAERPAPAGPTAVASRKAGAFVILDADRVHRVEGVPEGTPAEPGALRERAARVESTPYAELTELRVRAGLSGATALVATGTSGASWSVALPPEAVAAVQSALDGIDARLARGPAGPLHHPALPLTLVLGVIAVGMVTPGFLATLVPAVVLLVRPGPAPLAAFGAAALAGALLGLLDPGDAGLEAARLVAWRAAQAVLGGAALGLALLRIRGGETTRAGARAAGAGLGVVALLFFIPLLWSAASTWSALRVHQAAPGAASVSAALLGLAAVLATARRPAPRAWAAAVVLLAALPPALASHAFVERFARDPLLASAPRLATTEGTLRLLHRTRIGVTAADLRLSPSGRRYAVAAFAGPRGEDRRPRHLVGRLAGDYREVEALALEFLAEDRVLVLTASDGVPEVRSAAADDPTRTLWRRALPPLDARDLAVDPVTQAWQVSGTDSRTGEVVLLAGRAGEEPVAETRLRLPGRLDAEDAHYVAAAGSALAVEPRLDAETRPVGPLWVRALWWTLASVGPLEWELWLLEPRGARHLLTSGLDVRCPRPRLGDAAFVCVARDGGRSRLWRVDAVSGARAGLGWVRGEVEGTALDREGRLALRGEADLAVVELGARRIRRFALPPGADAARVRAVALVPGRLGTLTRVTAGTELAVYETR